MTFLLDINVLIALCDPQHVHHDLTHNWFKDSGRKAWATCPITENGFVRILCNPAYPNRLEAIGEALELLQALVATKGHKFIPADVSIRSWENLQGTTHKHLTDLYLLELARKHKAILVTLDQSIPETILPGIKGHVKIIQRSK